MPLRVIDQNLFVTDDGRMLYACGTTGFLIPDRDIPVFVRTRGRLGAAARVLSIVALIVMIVMNLKVELSFVLWTIFLVLATFAYSAIFRSWIRRHFALVADQPILDEIRELKSGRRGARWGVFAASSGAFVTLEYFHATGEHDGWFTVLVLFIVVALTGLQSAIAENQRAKMRARISSSITR